MRTTSGQIITDHMAQMQITYGLTFLVADSALYSAENLQKLAETRTKWITRVPATLREAQAVLAQADPQTMAPLMEEYRYQVLPSTYGGVEQRWMLIHSDRASRRRSAPWTNNCASKASRKAKPGRNYVALPSRVKPMREQALSVFEQGLQATFLHSSTVHATPRYGTRGRPRRQCAPCPDGLPPHRSLGLVAHGPTGPH